MSLSRTNEPTNRKELMNCEVATFVCNVIQENTYLLSTSDGHAAIIDCGCATASEQERLAQRIKQWGLSVDLLLFTHLHFDHLWGLPWALQTFPKARAYAHPIELAQAVSPEAQMRAWGFEVPERAFDLSQIHPLPSDQPLRLGEIPIYDLFVPGHTAGHVAYYLPSERIVFTGDVLFRGDIGRSDLPGGDYQTLLHSIKTQLRPLPDDTIVYPGHGPHTTIYNEKSNNPYIN